LAQDVEFLAWLQEKEIQAARNQEAAPEQVEVVNPRAYSPSQRRSREPPLQREGNSFVGMPARFVDAARSYFSRPAVPSQQAASQETSTHDPEVRDISRGPLSVGPQFSNSRRTGLSALGPIAKRADDERLTPRQSDFQLLNYPDLSQTNGKAAAGLVASGDASHRSSVPQRIAFGRQPGGRSAQTQLEDPAFPTLTGSRTTSSPPASNASDTRGQGPALHSDSQLTYADEFGREQASRSAPRDPTGLGCSDPKAHLDEQRKLRTAELLQIENMSGDIEHARALLLELGRAGRSDTQEFNDALAHLTALSDARTASYRRVAHYTDVMEGLKTAWMIATLQ
jgi:hypothetical protein